MIDYRVAERLVVLRLNDLPLNAIGLVMLDELRAAVRRAQSEPAVAAIVITGSPEHFSAGADVNIFRQFQSPDDCVRTSRLFQQAFQEVADSRIPVAAILAGRVAGSALELAAACRVRIATPGTSFAMPEVTLGINPGAGGTQRLPRLIGVESALRLMLTAETWNTQQAWQRGLVDAVCQYEAAFDLAEKLCLAESAPKSAAQPSVSDSVWTWAEKHLATVRPEVIAPREILRCVKVGLEKSFEAGLQQEQQSLAECMQTLAARNKIYLFFAARQASKPTAVHSGTAVPRLPQQAAVVGTGTMGAGIAQALVQAGMSVLLYDVEQSAVDRARQRIEGSLERRASEGKLSRQQVCQMLQRLSAARAVEQLWPAELVVEAVFEDQSVKQALLSRLEEVCRRQTIIASNTSTIPLAALAAGMVRPERLIGMHFFNPAHHMPLVEVIPSQQTAPQVVAAVLGVAKALRKTAVVVADRPGFLVNRLFVPYLKEAFWLLEEGADGADIDAVAQEFGFPMGPLRLADMAGLDILADTDRVLSRAYPRHGPLPLSVARLVQLRQLGQKSGGGVYSYSPGDYTPKHNPIAANVLAEVRQAAGRAVRKIDAPEIAERLVFRMIAEASWLLAEGVAQRESDIDVAMVLGVGFPDFRGGPLQYARSLGLTSVVQRLQKLAEVHGQRFTPCRWRFLAMN